jgi:hypothetical protein
MCQAMISPGNLCQFSSILSLSHLLRGLSDASSTSSSQPSAQVPFSAYSQRSLSLSWPRRGLSDAFSTSSSWPSTRSLLEYSSHSPLFSLYPLVCLARTSLLSCSFCQKETRVSLGLQDPVVLRADLLQLDHASIHGGG